MNFKQSISMFLKLLLFFLFIGYYSGITLFYHIHIVNDQAIAHSHFYKSESDSDNPIEKHSHPLSAYDVIHVLNKINSEKLTVSMPYQQPLQVAQSITRYFARPDIPISTRPHLPSRAPPAC